MKFIMVIYSFLIKGLPLNEIEQALSISYEKLFAFFSSDADNFILYFKS